jgi:hypothetical protein
MATTPVASNETGRVKRKFNPYQHAFHVARRLRTTAGRRAYTRLGLFAGRRGGKTDAGGIAAAEEAGVPESLGWCCAPSYPELHDYVLPAVLKAMPRHWLIPGKDGYSAQHSELRLRNGARMGFRSLDDPERGRGPGLDWAWIDEGRKIAQKAWDTLQPALLDKRGVCWLTTSPNAFDWCYKRFWLPAQLGDPGYWACKYKTAVNPAIDLDELEHQRKSMDPKWFQQEYEADFLSFAGTIFEYEEVERQILRPSSSLTDLLRIRRMIPEWPKLDPSRRMFASLDPGADHPFGAVFAIEADENLICVGEHLRRNDTIANHYADFQRLLAQWNPDRPFEPESWAIDRSQRQWQIEFQQQPYGVMTQAAPNDVIGGINRIHKWLNLRRLWFVEDLVPRTIEQLHGYVWDERNYDVMGRAIREAPKKEQDDLPDALRYLVMLQPEPEIEVVTAGVRDLKDFDESVRWAIERMRKINAIEKEAAEAAGFEDDEAEGFHPLEGDGDSYLGMGDFYRDAA